MECFGKARDAVLNATGVGLLIPCICTISHNTTTSYLRLLIHISNYRTATNFYENDTDLPLSSTPSGVPSSPKIRVQLEMKWRA
jgi:hypothetical protein